MKAYTLQQYRDAGCPEVTSPAFALLHAAVEGKVCDGCGRRFGGKNCGANQKLTAVPVGRTGFSVPTETVREEAARRGVSISEVRRQRNGGNSDMKDFDTRR